jgi:leucyl aminopeptidase
VIVTRRLPTGVLAFGDAQTAALLVDLGVQAQVLETGLGDREHYLVWVDASDRNDLPGKAKVLLSGERFAVVSIPAGAVECIAGRGEGIERLFDSPLRLPRRAARVASKAPLNLASRQFVAGLVSQVSEDTLVNNVLTLESFGTRYAASSMGHAAATWIRNQFLSYGIEDVEIQQWTPTYPGNVIATIPGTDPTAGIYILGGHFDSIVPNSTFAPGADDNATGTATVLECARILAPHQFMATIRLIAFSAEELGLLGSAAYASRSALHSEFINGMINVDMLGYRAPQDTRDLDLIVTQESDWLRLEAIAAQELFVPTMGVVSGKLLSGSSDHASFLREGFDAIFLHEDTGDHSPYIHTTNDIFGMSYNDQILHTESTRIALAMLSTLAEPVVVPVALQSFSALQVAEGIELTWQWSQLAESDISGVHVERATSAEGPYTRLTANPLLPGEYHYVDAGVEWQTTCWYRLAIADRQGNVSWSAPVRAVVESRSLRTALDAPWWSDASENLNIRYRIGPTPETSTLGIYDVRGRQVRTLVQELHLPGEYLRTWDGRDASGRPVASGIYMVHLASRHTSLSRKVVVLKP